MHTNQSKSFMYIHPFIMIVFFYSLGIYLEYKKISLALFALICFATALLIIGCTRSLYNKYIVILPIMIICGAYNFQYSIIKYDDFYTQVGNTSCSVTGTISSIIHANNPGYAYLLIIKDCKISNENKNMYNNGCIGIYCKTNNYTVDDTIKIKNVLFKKNKSDDYALHLIKEGMNAILFSNKNHLFTVINHPSWSINRWIYEKRMQLYKNLKSKLSFQTTTFFSSLFLGLKENSSYQKKMKEFFKYWGISHYLARSGLHVMISLMLWKMILRCIPFNFFCKQIMLLTLLFLYCLLSWTSLPFTRAFLCYILSTSYSLLYQQAHTFYNLVLVLFFILLRNPATILFLDFELSFGLTAALIIFSQYNSSKNNYNNR